MGDVCVQSMHQRRSLEDDANPRVTMTVDPPFVTLGQPKPALQVEIIPDLLERALADEKPGEKADHHRSHVLANRVLRALEMIDQCFVLLLAIGAALRTRLQGRGYFLDVLDILPDWLLLGLDMLQSPVNAPGQAAQLLLCEPPFCTSKFRWIDSRTSCKASAMRRPGGWSGPPWSSLRIPRTAAQ
jgi:hypothetical protein